MRYAASVVVAAVLGVGGCGSGSQQDDARAVPLGVPAGYFSGIAPLRDGRIVLGYQRDGVDPERGLSQHLRGTSRIERLPLPPDPACERPEYLYPATLDDGRVVYTKLCGPPSGPSTFTAFALDVAAGTEERLVTLPKNGSVAWDPRSRRGVAESSGGICATIAWVTAAGLDDRPIEIEHGGRRLRLDEEFRRTDETTCKERPRGASPAMASGGQRVAFFASPTSVGVDGQARLREPWNLYLLGANEDVGRLVLEDVSDPSDSAWSPDGEWIAFSGEVGDRGAGTWVYAPGTDTLRRVTRVRLGHVAWDTDGRHLLGTRGMRDERERDELVRVDAGAALADT